MLGRCFRVFLKTKHPDGDECFRWCDSRLSVADTVPKRQNANSLRMSSILDLHICILVPGQRINICTLSVSTKDVGVSLNVTARMMMCIWDNMAITVKDIYGVSQSSIISCEPWTYFTRDHMKYWRVFKHIYITYLNIKTILINLELQMTS